MYVPYITTTISPIDNTLPELRDITSTRESSRLSETFKFITTFLQTETPFSSSLDIAVQPLPDNITQPPPKPPVEIEDMAAEIVAPFQR